VGIISSTYKVRNPERDRGKGGEKAGEKTRRVT